MRTDTLAGLAIPALPEPDPAAWGAAGNALLAATPAAADAWGGGWRLNAARSVRLASGEQDRIQELTGTPSSAPALVTDGDTAHVDVQGQSLEISLAAPPSVEEAVRHAATAEGHALLAAPMPGRVVSVRATQGAAVAEHAVIVVIEAMKMEHAVATPLAGTVTRIDVAEGDQVQRGDPLAEVTAYDEPVSTDA